MAKICRHCRFAGWQLTEKGNVRKKQNGKCLYDYGPMPKLSIAVSNFRWPPQHGGIWWDMEESCPTFEAA